MPVTPRITKVPSQAKQKPKLARLWWKIHQIAGLKLSLFLSFILLTGTLATISHEIDWLLQPNLRIDSGSAPESPNWAAIAHSAVRQPGVAEILFIEEPTASLFASRVAFRDPNGKQRFLYAHPATGEIQGKGPWAGAARILRNMHRHINIPTKIGVPIVSSLAFLMLISFMTAFIVYPKWWRGFFKPIRFTKGARTAWGDFHRLAGLWSLWFVLLITLTSIWYFAESTGLQAPAAPSAKLQKQEISLIELGDSLETVLGQAQQAYPELNITHIVFPSGRRGAFRIQGQDKAWLVRQRANEAWVNPTTTEVLLIAKGTDLSVHQRISEMADPLHFGTFAGYWTKVPWFIFGLLLTGLSISGSAIYALRMLKAENRPATTKTSINSIWYGMGRWRWLAFIFTLTAFVMLPFLVFQVAY